MQDGAPQLHADAKNNILVHYKVRTGDIEEGFAVRISSSGTTAPVARAPPPAGSRAVPSMKGPCDRRGGRPVDAQGQQQICHALDLPPEKVPVIYRISGAFGGREDMSVQIVLACHVTRAPGEDHLEPRVDPGHHKRHPYIIEAKWGAKRDRTLTAAKFRSLRRGRVCLHLNSARQRDDVRRTVLFPNVHVDAYTVYATTSHRRVPGWQPAGCVRRENREQLPPRGDGPVRLR